MIKNIIFDFDGVIADSFEILYKVHKAYVPYSSKENYKTWFDGNILEKLGTLTPEQEEIRSRVRNKVPQMFAKLKINPQIKKELEQLALEYKLYIITSSTPTNLNCFFKTNDIGHLFKEILDRNHHKSKIEKFKVLKKKGVNNKNSVFVTDTLGDILEANKVRMKTIAVTWGFHTKEKLQTGKPHKIISSVDQIEKVISEEKIRL